MTSISPMMKPVVVIEDDKDTWLLLRDMLGAIGYENGRLQWFRSIDEIPAGEDNDAEIVITNLTFQNASPHANFERICQRYSRAPIIVITSNEEVDMVMGILRQGAQDYLIKGEVDKKILAKSIQYAIERKRTDNDYKRLFRENPAAMYIFEKGSLKFLDVNSAALHQYGYTREEFLKLTAFDIRPEGAVSAFVTHINTDHARYYDAGRWLHKRKNGTTFHVHVHSHVMDFDGRQAHMIVAINVDKAVRAEQALNKKVKEVEHILESMTDAFFTVNNEHEFTYVNKEFEKILQRRREEILAQNIWHAFPEAVGLEFYNGYYKAINEQVNVFFEEHLPILDIWLSVKAYPLDSGVAVYFIDLTQQKKAQERILQEEQNLRAIINNTNDMIWSVDREYRIISANDAFWRHIHFLTGKYKEDLTESDFGKEAFSQWAGYFDRAYAGEAYKIVWEEERDGEQRYAEISFNPIKNTDNIVTGISCFSRDITAETKLREKIITDDLNLKALIDNTEDLIWSIDEQLNLISANQSFRNAVQVLSGKMPLPGQSILDGKFGDEAVQQWKGYYSKGLKGKRFIIEQEADRGGIMRHTETRFNPIWDKSGKVIGVSCFTRDVTELKKYLQRVQQQNADLMEIAWLQSHKVRSHVATILGLTELINYDNPLDDGNLTILNGVKQSSEELDKVIREINDKTILIDKGRKAG